MGIPAYFSHHVIKENKNVLKSIKKNAITPSYLFLDSNSIIYDVIRSHEYTPNENDEFERMCIKEVCKQIKYYIALTKPTKMTFVAFDGVAPVAKLKQQRTRRYKNDFLRQKFPKERGMEHVGHHSWNSFMTIFTRITKYFANNNKVIVSASNEFGEGEHKIFNIFVIPRK